MSDNYRLKLMINLKFMAVFIATYESFENYVEKCVHNLFDMDCSFRKSAENIPKIRQTDINFRQQRVLARKRLDEVLSKGIKIESAELDRLRAFSECNFTKYEEDGFINWLSPEYEYKIKKRLLVINGKRQKKPNVALNSFMFFVDAGTIDLSAFNSLLCIRDLRNKYAHEMAGMLLSDVITLDSNALFDKLLSIYITINNFWSIEFDLSISYDHDINLDDYDIDNVINVDLYNLLLSIDVLFDKKFVIEKNWVLPPYVCLYECLMFPHK